MNTNLKLFSPKVISKMRINSTLFLTTLLFFTISCEEKITQDTTPPSIEIVSHNSGEKVSGVIKIEVKTEDDQEIEKVEFFIDDSLLLTDIETPYEFLWNTELHENSEYTVEVISSDNSGNNGNDEIILIVENFITFIGLYNREGRDNPNPNHHYGLSIKESKYGGYIVLGTQLNNPFLYKIDTHGDIEWNIDGDHISANVNRNFYEVHETMDGGYFFVSTAGICKIDYDGNAWWDNNSIQGGRTGNITSDGGYIIAGDSDHANANTDPQKILLTKTDSRGNEEWKKEIGELGFNRAIEIHQTTDGGYFVVGDGSIYKTNSEGELTWSDTTIKSLSGHQTEDGGYIVTGEYSDSDRTIGDFPLRKLDENGETEWIKKLAEIGEGDRGHSVQQTSDGGYIITGLSGRKPNLLLIKTDSNGEIECEKSYGEEWDMGKEVYQASDGGYIIVGNLRLSLGNEKSNIGVIKTDPEGNFP